MKIEICNILKKTVTKGEYKKYANILCTANGTVEKYIKENQWCRIFFLWEQKAGHIYGRSQSYSWKAYQLKVGRHKTFQFFFVSGLGWKRAGFTLKCYFQWLNFPNGPGPQEAEVAWGRSPPPLIFSHSKRRGQIIPTKYSL